MFKGKQKRLQEENEKLVDELYRQIGKLKLESEWIKKNLHSLGVEEKRQIIEFDHRELSVRRQGEILKLHKSNLYYEPVKVSEDTLGIM
jgi:hypothetical protein